MKKIALPFPLAVLVIFILSCNKNNDSTEQPVPVVPETPLLTHADSSSAIAHLWQTVKDSLSSGGNYYWIEGGSMHVPTPGVYLGNGDDSYNFKPNDSVIVHHQGYIFRLTCPFIPPAALNISGMNTHGPAYIFKLTSSEFVLNWINTSPNGEHITGVFI